MKKLLLLLALACTLAAETKQEAELKKKLADAVAELTAEKARSKALQTGTKKLTEAVETQIETSRGNTEKLDAVSSKIAAVEATAKSQTAITENATKKLAATVTEQNAHVTSAINAQVEQQKRALAQAHEEARRLEIRNKVIEQRAADTLRNQEASIREIASLKQVILQQDHKAEVAAAKDQTAIAHDKYQFYNSLAVPLCGVIGTLLLILQGLIAIRQNAKLKEMSGVQKETHTLVNGRYTVLEQENKALKAEGERLEAALRGKTI